MRSAAAKKPAVNSTDRSARAGPDRPPAGRVRLFARGRAVSDQQPQVQAGRLRLPAIFRGRRGDPVCRRGAPLRRAGRRLSGGPRAAVRPARDPAAVRERRLSAAAAQGGGPSDRSSGSREPCCRSRSIVFDGSRRFRIKVPVRRSGKQTHDRHAPPIQARCAGDAPSARSRPTSRPVRIATPM